MRTTTTLLLVLLLTVSIGLAGCTSSTDSSDDTSGTQDSDGDGFTDDEDLCPTQYSTLESPRKGCPRSGL